MPSKSRRGRGRPSSRSARKRTVAARAAQQSTVTEDRSVARAPATPEMPVSSGAYDGVRYPYIATELRRIGILAAILMAILIILAFVLA